MNKVDRIKAVIDGREPDKIPAGFWFHYNSKMTTEEMANAHLDLYEKTDMDIVKIMQDYPYPIVGEIKTIHDWDKVKLLGTDTKEYKKLEEVIKRIADKLKGEAMIFQTMFGPFKAASMAFGDEVVMNHAKENPVVVANAINRIGEVMAEWADKYLDAGADGIYYSAQFAEVGRFTKQEWEQLVKPSDLKVLNVAANRDNKYNILHICGEPDYNFEVHVDRFYNYPGDLINWSVKDNHYSLERGRDLFDRAILGGLNNKGNILTGTEEDIRKEVRNIIDTFGNKGLMIGADCTIQGQYIDVDKMRIAVEEAHCYKK